MAYSDIFGTKKGGLEKDNEQFLLETGLIRFKKILSENDTLGKTYEFEIHSRSPATDFDIDDTKEIYKELDRVGYEFLDHLWIIKYKGAKAL